MEWWNDGMMGRARGQKTAKASEQAKRQPLAKFTRPWQAAKDAKKISHRARREHREKPQKT